MVWTVNVDLKDVAIRLLPRVWTCGGGFGCSLTGADWHPAAWPYCSPPPPNDLYCVGWRI